MVGWCSDEVVLHADVWSVDGIWAYVATLFTVVLGMSTLSWALWWCVPITDDSTWVGIAIFD